MPEIKSDQSPLAVREDAGRESLIELENLARVIGASP